MCYKVSCNACGKFSWGGCGQHLTTLYSKIDKGKHCMCRPWPGVVIPSESKQEQVSASATATAAAAATAANLKS